MSLAPPNAQPLTGSTPEPAWHARHSDRLKDLWLLIALVAVWAVGNIYWLRHHFLTIPPPWDQAFYLYMGLRYVHTLLDQGVAAMLTEFMRLSPDVAPLFPLTSLPLYLLFGPSRLVAYMTNIGYLFALLTAVYLLGAYIYGRWTGILAAFVVATFTATVNYSRDYLLEFPATAFVTLAMYAFIRAAEFQRRRWCLAFGVLAGLSVLTKTMTGVFFIGPVLLAVGRLINRRQLHSAVFINGLLAVGAGGVVASVWWGPNFRTAVGYLWFYGFQEGAAPYSGGGSAIFSGKNLSYYALALSNHGISFLYACVFVILVLMRGLKRLFGLHGSRPTAVSVIRAEWTLWVWLLIGYAILTVVPNKGEERYAQPLLSPIALLLAGSVAAIGWHWLRRVMVLIVVAIGGFNYLGLTYGLPVIPRQLYVHPLALVSHEYPHFSWVRSKIHRLPDTPWRISDILFVLANLYDKHRIGLERELCAPLTGPVPELTSAEDVRLIFRVLLQREPHRRELQGYTELLRQGKLTRERVIELLKASAAFKNQRANVLVVPDHPLFNASTLRYYAEIDRLPLRFSHLVNGPITAERLQGYAFILTKPGGYQGPEFSTRYTNEIQAVLLQREVGFVALPDHFPFPDGSPIVIYAAQSMLTDEGMKHIGVADAAAVALQPTAEEERHDPGTGD